MSQSHVRGWTSRRSSVVTALLVASLTISITLTAPAAAVQETNSSVDVTEDEYIETAPEPGDEYFEAAAADGSWISYVNPRDEYRDPYLGDGSGKMCVTLLNDAGEPIVGETVPNTTATVPTGDSLEWHSGADPMTVDYPLTEHYDRPLDADQFGTADDISQGDGYMDSHCIEFHGPAIGDDIEYGEATVEGDHADRIEVVGYIQRDGQAWDTDIDPVDSATSYETAGGGWTYREPTSHGQVVVVLQLAADESADADSDPDGTVDDGSENVVDDGSEDVVDSDPDTNATTAEVDNATTESTNDDTPGFGVVASIVAMLSVVVALRARQ